MWNVFLKNRNSVNLKMKEIRRQGVQGVQGVQGDRETGS